MAPLALAMIINFPSHSKVALLLPEQRRTKRERKSGCACACIIGGGGLAAPNVNVKAAEQRPLSVTSPMGAGGESNKLKGLTMMNRLSPSDKIISCFAVKISNKSTKCNSKRLEDK